MSHPVRTQARALLVRDQRIALVRQSLNAREWRWVLPGGGQDEGESLTEALVRECAEELAVEATVGSLRLIREYVPAKHPDFDKEANDQCIDFVFDVTIPAAQDISVGPGLEEDSDAVEWFALDALPALYPAYLEAWLPVNVDRETIAYVGDQL
ncbi:MAG: NUDIX domain-containing protein [Pseudomonadota bacterium]